ncbi:MAG TPA: proline dehydrogenase family protein [Gaiellaceae bacterium]|nr:proline dehydrogenase family protein [Gaiellaceae bacterium]
MELAQRTPPRAGGPAADALPGARLNANTALRKAILTAADNPQVRRLVSKHGMRLGGSRFVAGETMEDSVRALRGLNGKGLWANTTLLGEAIGDEDEARAVADEYVVLVDRLATEELRANVALKLTHLGLDIDEELAYENVRRIVERGSFIRIDMEQSTYVDATLRIYRRLRADGYDNVGTVLQAYLFRTEDDLASLLPLRPNLRLVKGAYLEPPDIAYPKKPDVDAAYVRLLETMLLGNGHTAIATHDEQIIEHAIRFADERRVPHDSFEFQMLYGVRPQLQLALAARGYKVLVATPYGPEWYPYLMRRLGERPANALFLLRNLIRG